MRTLLIASAIAAALAGTSAQAAEDYYLKVPGITGDVTDDHLKGWISVTSFGTGISNDGSSPTGRCSEFRISKPLDLTSAQIALAVANHQAFASIQLLARKAGEVPQTLTFTLLNAHIDSVRFAGDNVTSASVETLAIRPMTVKIQYQPLSADGALGAPIESTIDCSNR